MPNRAHSGIRGVPWHICERCGQDWPTDKLSRQTGYLFGGLLVCPKCIDNPAIEFRDETIKQRLENSPLEMDVADILKTTPTTETEGGM